MVTVCESYKPHFFGIDVDMVHLKCIVTSTQMIASLLQSTKFACRVYFCPFLVTGISMSLQFSTEPSPRFEESMPVYWWCGLLWLVVAPKHAKTPYVVAVFYFICLQRKVENLIPASQYLDLPAYLLLAWCIPTELATLVEMCRDIITVYTHCN